ncbi:MAG: 3-deoxy-7-phosphoheptulonate synthase [Verrucomicrobia bacterium]|nr:3-deoxy-7-phosphoheptulonate synthase [Verrucomicrobiota bacterium]MBS0636829.1 3-deoxy-7-phosphoheptulonate synthase [Verrucomicrobiota bacterium]
MLTPNELKRTYASSHIAQARTTIANILQGKDPRRLLIVGPCSIHNIDYAKEYAKRLKTLANEVQDSFYICMRAYFEKPRTTLGWKGLLYDPFLDGSNKIEEGLKMARELLEYLQGLEIAAATEFLEPLSYHYLGDLISWGSIGARTCHSPIHRQLASYIPMPIGFKNPIDGNIEIAIQACLTARKPHTFLGIDDNGKIATLHSEGNSLCHVVLRGSVNGPNFDEATSTIERLKQEKLLDAIIVDCSHGNCQNDYRRQKEIFEQLMHQTEIRGIMIESFLEAGNTNIHNRGQSITDPCIDWEMTESMIKEAVICV